MSFQNVNLGRVQHVRIASFWIVSAVVGTAVLFTQSAWETVASGAFEIAELIELAGLALIGGAILGRLWCTLYVGGRKSDEVVQAGPYSVVRNPLYVFSIIGAAGVGAQSGSIIIALVCAALAYFVLAVTAKREEAYLADKFGAIYEDYRNRVPAFFPDFSLFQDPDTIIVVPRRLYRTLFDALFFFAAFPLLEFLEYLQRTGAIPVLFRLF